MADFEIITNGGRRRRWSSSEKPSDYGRPVRVSFEATGNYHRALAYHLAATGFEMKPVSPVALARTRDALHNSGAKTTLKATRIISC